MSNASAAEVLDWAESRLGGPVNATTFANGIELAELLSTLTGRRIRVQKSITTATVRSDNIRVCLEFCEHLGLNQNNLDAKAFSGEGNEDLVIAFLDDIRKAFPDGPQSSPPTAESADPEAAQERVMGLIATVLEDGSEEETAFLKLTKKFNKGKIQAAEFVLAVESSLGGQLTSQVLPEMVLMLAGKPEIQDSLAAIVQTREAPTRSRGDTMVMPSLMPLSVAEDERASAVTSEIDAQQLMSERLDQAEEISMHKATFNEAAQALFKQQSKFMALRDRPKGGVPATILQDQTLVIEVLDMRHLCALNRYRIVKETYAPNPDTAVIEKLERELESLDSKQKDLQCKCDQALEHVSKWAKEDLARVEGEMRASEGAKAEHAAVTAPVKKVESVTKEATSTDFQVSLAGHFQDEKVTYYRIKCSLRFGVEGKPHDWMVLRRYSEFADLYKLFTKKKNLTLPRLPPKRLFGHGEEVIAERMSGLSEMLGRLVELAREDMDLQAFLKPDSYEFPVDMDDQLNSDRFTF